MVARPGRIQTTFTAGELDEMVIDRTELKYYHTGAKRAENVELHPQGGVSVRDGFRHITMLDNTSSRLIPFKDSKGKAWELALRHGHADILNQSGIAANMALPFTSAQLPYVTWAHKQDTSFLFHKDVQSRRIRVSDAGWAVDTLPYEDIPNYDYGGSYTNAVPAEWEINFVGMSAGKRFRLTISGLQTISIPVGSPVNWSDVRGRIESAILDLPNVAPGIAVTMLADGKFKIVFSGTDNAGDGWAVSGTAIDDADAAIPAFKLKVGVPPGEPIISAGRGWPRCGLFFQQRLLAGGFRSLGNDYMTSITGRYFSFNTELDEANGAFVVPLDSEGGETINHLVDAHHMLVLTSEREYWVADRAIDKTKPTNHVEISTNGSKEGVPVLKNEGAAIYCHASGSVLSEIRYTDYETFVSSPLTILCPDLFEDVTDMALRKTKNAKDPNLLGVIDAAGRMRTGCLLRDQDVTGFVRYVSGAGKFRAIATNGRNEMALITERGGSRRLERLEPGLLLDAAKRFSFPSARSEITGLDHLNGMDVWVIGDGDIYGPYRVQNNRVALDVAVQAGEVGLFSPPVLETLPPPRNIADHTVLRRKARIHSVWINVQDTTSLAVAVNGQPPVDVALRSFNSDLEKPELEDGYTGLVELRGLTGFVDEPTVTITQIRPGRLTVRSVTAEAKL